MNEVFSLVLFLPPAAAVMWSIYNIPDADNSMHHYCHSWNLAFLLSRVHPTDAITSGSHSVFALSLLGFFSFYYSYLLFPLFNKILSFLSLSLSLSVAGSSWLVLISSLSFLWSTADHLTAVFSHKLVDDTDYAYVYGTLASLIHTHTHTRARTHPYKRHTRGERLRAAHTYTDTCAYPPHTHTHTDTHTQTHTHTHTHTHTRQSRLHVWLVLTGSTETDIDCRNLSEW